jgi:hypothetical protein
LRPIKLLAFVPALFLSFPAQSQQTATSNGISSASSGVFLQNNIETYAGVEGGGSSNGTATINTNSRIRNGGTTRIINTPSIGAPPLAAAGLETCLGSASIGISGPGFGVSGGSTTTDKGCDARLDARTLAAMGYKEAALARLCQKPEIAAAMPAQCGLALTTLQPATAPLVARAAPFVATQAASVQTPSLVPDRYSGGRVQVIEKRTQQPRWCDNYLASEGKCLKWSR